MSRGSLWIVVVVAASWIGFLMGYAMSAHTGGSKIDAGAETAPVSAGAGGYGR